MGWWAVEPVKLDPPDLNHVFLLDDAWVTHASRACSNSLFPYPRSPPCPLAFSSPGRRCRAGIDLATATTTHGGDRFVVHLPTEQPG